MIVTGCFDWLHSGHIQFFLDAAALGELYVVVGSDRNVRHLKGPGHPLRNQDERRYMAQAVRAVHRAEVSTGSGWMDAEPEIARIQPHLYVVNERWRPAGEARVLPRPSGSITSSSDDARITACQCGRAPRCAACS